MRDTCPEQADFIRPLLITLGQSTNLTAGIGVDSKSLIPTVFRAAGLDPNNIPREWYGNGRSNGIRRSVQFCYLALKRGLYTIAKPEPLTTDGGKRGWWALTEAGVLHAKDLIAEHRPEPGMGVFRDPVLKVLGEATNYQPNQPVAIETLTPLILREAGFDPDALPAHWILQGTSGVYRKISLAYYALYQRRKTPLVLTPQNGLWAFTEAGAAHVRQLVGKAVSEPVAARIEANATARWFEEQLPLGLQERLEKAVARKMRISAVTQRVQDHVQNFYVRQIRRDALAKHLVEGEKMPWSKIVTYALRSASTDIRDDAHNPVCRTIYGARTKVERDSEPLEPQMTEDHWDFDTDGSMIPEETVEGEFEATHDFNVLQDRLMDLIRARYRNGDRIVEVLKMRIADASPAEIAAAQGCSLHRGASLSVRARICAAEVWDEMLAEVG